MLNDVYLIHRSGPIRFNLGAEPEVFEFKTCMRSLILASEEELVSLENLMTSEDQVLRGEGAYRFLLQVICGLHSPLIGETEVSGQFKNAVAAFPLPTTPWGRQLKRFFQSLFEDAKRVRQLHLKDLGSQSYGSILRRELKGLERIHFLGAGHLVQEILPWVLKEQVQVHVHGRDPEKIKRELKAFNGIKIHGLDEYADLTRAEAVVIAAPVAASWVKGWVPADATPEVLVDLRGDWAEDRILGFARVLGLGELFERISSNQAHLEARKRAALAEIDSIVLERSRYVEYRPFGWEDVCA